MEEKVMVTVKTTVLFFMNRLKKPFLAQQIAVFWICPKITHQAVLRQQLPLQFRVIFRWQVTLPPPRPLPGTSSTNCLSPVNFRIDQRTISKRNPYSRIKQKHCCTCNMGKCLQISILSISQTKELIPDTGNRDQVFLATPL